MRPVARKASAPVHPLPVGCGEAVQEKRTTYIQFEVGDRPAYIFVCGLGDTELVVKRLMRYCERQWTKEVPVKDACGDLITITDCDNEAVILMPGHYRIEIKDCPDTEFPEEFDFDLLCIPFEFAKCWLAARAK